MKNKFLSYIATLGPIGYFPASGTVASLSTLPFIIALSNYQLTLLQQLSGWIVLFVISFLIIAFSLRQFTRYKDPSEVVLDEVVGQVLVFIGLPITVKSLIFGFVLFRLFDIAKFGIIDKAQRLPGAWGILLDDCLAAGIAHLILRFLI